MFQKPIFWLAIIALALGITAFAYLQTGSDEAANISSDTATDAAREDAETLSPGIEYVVLRKGDGAPVDAEYIRYDAEISTADGESVSSSKEDGSYTYAVAMLKEVAPGLADALLATPLNETRRYWIDPELLQPGFSESVDQVHIMDLTVLEGRNPLPAPADVAAAPEDAETTDSGIAYVVLAEGPDNETAHPSITDTITIHYSGWQTDGKMFDSSEVRGEPAEFPLDRLIAGWQQAIPLMTRGDRYRFWIPGELAYDNSSRPGVPKGTLVFEIELLDFIPTGDGSSK